MIYSKFICYKGRFSSRRLRVIATVGAAGLALLAAGLWFFFRDGLLYGVRDHYGELLSPRQARLNERILNAPVWLACLAVAACVWGGITATPKKIAVKFHPALIAALAVVIIGLNLFYSTREWARYGKPCWDNYCTFAERLHGAVFESTEATRAKWLQLMHDDYHANSPIGPLFTAVAHQLTGFEIISSYRLTVGIFMGLMIVLTGYLLRRELRAGWAVTFACLFLLATNVSVIRSAIFPQTDPFVVCWIVGLLWAGREREKNPGGRRDLICFLILCSGLFVKLSFLPALALIPLLSLWPWRKKIFYEGIVFALIPMVFYLFFQWRMGLFANYGVEMQQIKTTDSSVWFHLEAMFKMFWPCVLPLCLAGKPEKPFEKMLWVWVALFVISLWVTGSSGWCRFYLAVMPALILLCARGLQRLRDLTGDLGLSAYVALVAALNYTALQMGLYSEVELNA